MHSNPPPSAPSPACPARAEAGLAAVEAVPSEPAASFEERFRAAVAAAAAAGRPFDAVYVSTTSYLTQQALVPSVPAFVHGLRAAAAAAAGGSATSGQAAVLGGSQPLIIVDGYHGFAALPVELGEVAGDCCYVAGLLKHAGAGSGAQTAWGALTLAAARFVRAHCFIGRSPIITWQGWLPPSPQAAAPTAPS